MPALTAEPWRGAAVAGVRITLTPGNGHFAWVSYDVNTTQPLADQTTWEDNPGASLTLRFRWTIGGPGSGQQAPTFANVSVRLPGAVVDLGTVWAVAFPAADTEVTRTFHFDSDPLSGVLDALRSGTLELLLSWGSTGGVTPWSVTSRGTAAGLLVTNEAIWARGYARSRVVLATHSISNVSLGGAEPSTFAYPDPIFVRDTISAVLYEAVELDYLIRQSGTTKRTGTGGGAITGVTRDSTFNAAATQFNGDFAAVSTALDGRISIPAPANFGGDNNYAFAASGHAAGWTQTSETQLDSTADATGNSAVTINTPTRTSATDVVNFGLHTVAATFKIANARSELLGNTAPSGAAGSNTANVKSRDITGSVDEAQLATALTPNASGLYTVSAVAYSGPTSTASRGTGPNGDTAAHTTGGKDKGIRPVLTQTAAPTVNASARLWALSDLLRLDVHPQKSATLAHDTNPYASPGDAEDTVFAIAVDLLHLFAFVGDVNGLGRQSITATGQVFDPDGNSVSGGGPNSASTLGGGDLGWIKPQLFQLAAASPAGQWTCRIKVEIGDGGDNGNYGDGAAPGTGLSIPGSLLQVVSFSSPYSADKVIALDGPNALYIGETVTYVVRYAQLNTDGTITHRAFDSSPVPSVRVFELNRTTGDERDVLATTALTGPLTPAAGAGSFPITPTGVYYTFSLTADAPLNPPGHMIVRIVAQFAGGKVIYNYNVDVLPRFAVKVGPLANRF